MTRQARLDARPPRLSARDGGQAPGLLQHVIARGIEGRQIFKDDKDCKAFLERLTLILEETQTQCYVYPVKCEAYFIGALSPLCHACPVPYALCTYRLRSK